MASDGNVGAPGPELRQTRNLTSAELGAVSRDWSLLLERQMGRSISYRVIAYLTWAFLGFLAISVWMAASALDDSRLALQLAVAFVGSMVSWVIADRVSRRLQQRIYWDRYREGASYALDDQGVGMTSSNGRQH